MATAEQGEPVGRPNRKRVWASVAVGVCATVGLGAMFGGNVIPTVVASRDLPTPDRAALASAHNGAPVATAQTVSPINPGGAPTLPVNSIESATTAPTKLYYAGSTESLTVDDAAVVAALADQDHSINLTPEGARADIDLLEKDAQLGRATAQENEIVENNVTAGIVLALMRTQITRPDGSSVSDRQIRESIADMPPALFIMKAARQKARQLIDTYAPDAEQEKQRLQAAGDERLSARQMEDNSYRSVINMLVAKAVPPMDSILKDMSDMQARDNAGNLSPVDRQHVVDTLTAYGLRNLLKTGFSQRGRYLSDSMLGSLVASHPIPRIVYEQAHAEAEQIVAARLPEHPEADTSKQDDDPAAVEHRARNYLHDAGISDTEIDGNEN